MRFLDFDVNAQRLSKNPECNFTEIVAGTNNYLRARFSFSSEWDGCAKAVSFWRAGKEYAVLLTNGNECTIPSEVLIGMTFGVSVTGQRGPYRITTNRVIVRQEVYR